MSEAETLDSTAPDYTIDVNFNPHSLELEFSTEHMPILAGSNLLLRFNDLPSGWSPMVEFRNENGRIVVSEGPFEQVVVGRNQILAVNARSDIDRFQTRALIQRGFGIHSESDASVIFTHWVPFKLGRDSEEERLVTVQVAEGENGLTVHPQHIAIRGGMRVRWDFSAVAGKHHQPMVAYGRPFLEEKPVDAQEFFGPHENFVYRSSTLVEGNGNNGIKGVYRYEVYLVDIRTRAIVIRSSADPRTDNEGDVIQP